MLCCAMLVLFMVGLRKVFVGLAWWAGREFSSVTAMPPGARRVVTTELPSSAVLGR